ncbi:MAG: radical SAM protein [Anaerolineae bacterium]
MELGPRSLIIRMDLSERCNLRCTMCYFRDGAGTYDMPAEVWDRIAGEVLPLAHTVHLSCGAEPMMSRLFIPALEKSRQARIPAIRLISNGTLLSDKNAQALIDNQADLVVISLDGSTKETYEHIRVGSKWEKVIANIRRLQEMKKTRGSDRPRLMLAFVVQKTNLAEIPAFIDLAHELGVSEVQFQELVLIFPDMEKDAIHQEALQHEADRVIDEARRKADAYGMRLFNPPMYFRWEYHPGLKGLSNQYQHLAQTVWRGWRQRSLRANWTELQYRVASLQGQFLRKRYIQRCYEPWRTAVIHANGEVVPCSLWQGGPMGSLQKDSFVTVWNNDEYRRLRDELQNGNLRPGCRACPAYSSEQRYRIN